MKHTVLGSFFITLWLLVISEQSEEATTSPSTFGKHDLGMQKIICSIFKLAFDSLIRSVHSTPKNLSVFLFLSSVS